MKSLLIKKEFEKYGLQVVDIISDDFGIVVEVKGDVEDDVVEEIKNEIGYKAKGLFFGNRIFETNFSHVEESA